MAFSARKDVIARSKFLESARLGSSEDEAQTAGPMGSLTTDLRLSGSVLK